MNSLSKLLNKSGNITCADALHPGLKCSAIRFALFKESFIGCYIPWIPICTIPLLTNIKHLNRNLIQTNLLRFLQSGTVTFLISRFFFESICLFSNIFGKLNSYTSIALPLMIDTFISSYFFDKKVMHLTAYGLSILVLDNYINYNNKFKFINNYKLSPIIIYTIINAIIVQLLRDKKISTFWLYPPTIKPENWHHQAPQIPSEYMDKIIFNSEHICYHNNSCDSYIKEGIMKYLQWGLGIECVRIVIKNFQLLQNQPIKFITSFLKMMNFRLVGYLVTYIGLYRFLNCLINRKCNKETIKGHILCTLIAGLSFGIYPNRTILAHAIISLIDNLYRMYLDNAIKCTSTGTTTTTTTTKINSILKFINKIPMGHLTVTVCMATIIHIALFSPWERIDLFYAVTRLSTNGKFSDFQRRLLIILLGYSDENTLYLFGLTK